VKRGIKEKPLHLFSLPPPLPQLGTKILRRQKALPSFSFYGQNAEICLYRSLGQAKSNNKRMSKIPLTHTPSTQAYLHVSYFPSVPSYSYFLFIKLFCESLDSKFAKSDDMSRKIFMLRESKYRILRWFQN
jgi:hypothetical protein